MGQSKQNAVFFYDKGYRVLEDGTPVNPKGSRLKGHSSRKDGRLHLTTSKHKETVRCPVHALVAYQLYSHAALPANVHIRHLNEVLRYARVV